MRVMGKTILFFAVLLLIAGFGSAQQPFFPGAGGGGQDVTTLIRIQAVKEEIKLTDEQSAKIPGAVMKALAEVLTPEQLTRLRQIELQQKGSNAFTDAKVQADLKLSGDQKEAIKNVLEESQKSMRELFKELQGGGGNFQGVQEKMGALRKETSDKILDVLSADQKKNWTAMLGDDFKMPTFGKGKGDFFKKKKKDEQ